MSKSATRASIIACNRRRAQFPPTSFYIALCGHINFETGANWAGYLIIKTSSQILLPHPLRSDSVGNCRRRIVRPGKDDFPFQIVKLPTG